MNLRIPIAIFVTSVLIYSCFIGSAYADGGTKNTTFPINGGICDFTVTFSWDKDIWQPDEYHQVGLTVDASYVSTDVTYLSVRVTQIIIRLDYQVTDSQGNTYPKSVELLSQDTSSQMTQIVTVNSNEFSKEPRYFSFQVQTQLPYLNTGYTRSELVDLYYLIKLYGNYVAEGPTQQGSGSIDSYISNSDRMSGGINDPVWITVGNPVSSPTQTLTPTNFPTYTPQTTPTGDTSSQQGEVPDLNPHGGTGGTSSALPISDPTIWIIAIAIVLVAVVCVAWVIHSRRSKANLPSPPPPP